MENVITMKIKLTILFLFSYFLSFSQVGYKIIKDRAIVGQEKRMVHRKWGDWYPKPKYKHFLGLKIQTSITASAVWGYPLGEEYFFHIPFSNERNKKYKKGKDIRPLKVTGLQNQRYGERIIQKKTTEKIKKEVEILKEKSQRDFAHWTNLTVDADLLWLWYYKKMLKPLKDFPKTPQNYAEWKLDNPTIYLRLKQNGEINALQEQLDILKHDYKISRTANIPRGKRILLYHKTLLGWRKFEKNIEYYNQTAKIFIYANDNLTNKKNYTLTNASNVNSLKSDEEIVLNIIEKYPIK